MVVLPIALEAVAAVRAVRLSTQSFCKLVGGVGEGSAELAGAAFLARIDRIYLAAVIEGGGGRPPFRFSSDATDFWHYPF